jgi:O-antigen/teichoic acid export membrane protein
MAGRPFRDFLSHWLSAKDSDDLRRKRLAAMLNGLFTSLGNRLLSVVISLVSVPLTIGYLGTERYGAWIAIGAILAWVGLTDLGLANGLSNAVTSDAARDRHDRVRMHVSNFLLLIGSLSAASGLVAFCLWPFINWSSVFGIADPSVMAEVRTGMAFALGFFLLRLPFAASNRIYIAYQEGHIGNFWGAASNLLTLGALIAVTRTEGGLPLLVLALAGVPFLVDVASSIWLFGLHRPGLRPQLRAIDRSGFGEIMKVGTQFFLIQVMALVTFQTDVLVISHFLGAARVPTYNLTYQLFNYATLPQALLFSYLWAAYNEAITRGDIAWVRRAVKWNVLGGLAWSAAAVAGLILIAKPFIGWWAGHDLIPSTALVWLMAGWVLMNAVTNSIACLLAAASHLRYQLIYSAVSTVSNILLSVLLVTRFGPEGVIAATLLSYALFVLGPILIDSNLLLKRLARQAAPDPAAQPRPA